MLHIVKQHHINGSKAMNATTTVTVVFIGLLCILTAGSAVYSAAKGCADRINERNNATIEAMFGN